MTASPPETPVNVDVAIIGAGPVGLFGVFACGMLGFKTQLFDALPDIGGQCTALYPEKPIYDIPGFASIKAGELIAGLEAQAAPFAPTYHLGAPLTTFNQNPDGTFHLVNGNQVSVNARAVIIAAGAGAFGPNRPPLENLAAYENHSVFYAVREPNRLQDRTVVIAGGGDSAIDWANLLAPIARHVYLVHRRDAFRAAPASLQQIETYIQAGKIEKITPYQLDRLSGNLDQGTLTHVHVADLNGKTRALPADTLLCFYGLSTSLGVLNELGLGIQGHQIAIDPTTAATNLPGVHAVGDIALYPHKQKLIMTGFAEMSQAAQAIYAQLRPGEPLHHEHSTTKGVPHLPKA